MAKLHEVVQIQELTSISWVHDFNNWIEVMQTKKTCLSKGILAQQSIRH